MRTPLVAGNWKMNTNAASAEELAGGLVQRLASLTGVVQVVVCPPFPYLTRVAAALEGSKIALGAQNCHSDVKGAFTGETSPAMLADCGCTWVIVGHSERRHILGETDDFIRRKLNAALASGLNVILCVGEVLAERQKNLTEMVVEQQLLGCLEGLAGENLARMAVAYEPVWAIGTGHVATPQQAEEVHAFTRHWVENRFGPAAAGALRVLYGGSVNPGNAANLMAQPNVDGLLVGGASLVADDFAAIVKTAAATTRKS